MASSWDWVSARWWKFDFHNHTPASADYGKGPDQAQHQQMSEKEWLLNYMRAGIDCVAVTDHNSGAWIDPLKQALNELDTERHPEYRPLHLFPGVEITVNSNIHILAIFPKHKTTSDIDSLLGAVGYRAVKGQSNGCSEKSAFEVVHEIVVSGGLAIPAHVDTANGLFNLQGNTLEQILLLDDICAMEMTDRSNSKPTLYHDKKISWSEVLGSDSHHPSGSDGHRYPGSHFTWVKMSEPSFDGLRLALIDGEISLKRSDEFCGNPNTHGQLTIECIKVDSAKYLGRENVFDCQLNPWLNTIIGGRGTGKSTALEFLRIALMRKSELPDSLGPEFTKYGQVSKNRHDEGLLTDSTILTTYFRKDGGRFRITWRGAENQYKIEEEVSDDEWHVAEGDINQRFPIRIYSQKQIFELAKHPEALLRVVDDAPEVNYREWKGKWDELLSQYMSICAQEREVLAGLQEENVIKGHLDDVRRKLEVFEKAGHADVLRNYQRRQRQKKAIESWEELWSDNAQRIRDLAAEQLPPPLDDQQFSTSNDENQDLFDAVNEVRSLFQGIQSDLEKVAARIDGIKNTWKERKPNLTISQSIDNADQNYAHLLEQLSEVGAADPADYGRLVRESQELEERLRRVNEKRDTLKRFQQEASECLENIHNHRQQITERRERFLADILRDNVYVQISVIPYGNTARLEEEFRTLINRSTGGFERDIGAVDSGEGLLSLLSPEHGTPVEESVQNIKSALLKIYNDDSATVAAAKDRRFVSHIQNLSPEQIDRIRCWFPEDTLDVRYSLKDSRSFKPVEQGSPGQKTAALLAFIFSYGNEPLILDQPEDDLDNHLIYDLIVTHLRNIKQQRQVLIVTHNANIVVNGDAENVVVFDVRSGQTVIAAQGGLQDLPIRKEICRVMEGGQEAFDQRYKRINAGR